VLFTGKGGVGKTTLAAATAARLARSGRKTLVVSTDPAHSLGDALEAELSGEPAELEPGLFGAHVDTRTLLDHSWGELQGHLRTVLAGAGVDELVADELTVLPGVEELLALGEVRRAAESGPWEVVVVDCGPTAETLRLLALPEALSGYLERLFPAHRRAVRGLLAGLSGGGRDQLPAWDRTIDALDGLAERLTGLRAFLAAEQTSIRLVLTPERVVAAETRRTLTALALHGLRVDGLVANRVQPAPPRSLRGPAARWLRERHTEQQAVLAELQTLSLPVRTAAYTAAEPTGIPALVQVAASLYGTDDPAASAPAEPEPLLQVRRSRGVGGAVDSEFELVLRLPGAAGAPLELARVDDDLAVTAGGTRRMVGLPSVLRRCTITAARLDGDDLCVVFAPDPAQWPSVRP
jgi:arsenite/tail-anchored protein-transporting ATPase